jgi:hypothetical protein
MLLRSSQYTRNVSWEQIGTMVRENMDVADPLHQEFLDLVTKSQKIYTPLRKKKRSDVQLP